MDLEKTPLGYEYSRKDLEYEFMQIYGGVGWPGERPGFAVVLGMDREKKVDSRFIYLLDEFESFDLRTLVRQCGALDYKYKPGLWIGDRKNDAADRLIREMNKEMELPTDSPPYPNIIFTSKERRKPFALCSTPILDMNHVYQFMLTELKRLLDPDHKRLFLKDSKILNYLSTIEPSDIAKLELGEYPAIQALAFAVIEMRQREQYLDSEPYEEDMSIAKSYAVNSCF